MSCKHTDLDSNLLELHMFVALLGNRPLGLNSADVKQSTNSLNYSLILQRVSPLLYDWSVTIALIYMFFPPSHISVWTIKMSKCIQTCHWNVNQCVGSCLSSVYLYLVQSSHLSVSILFSLLSYRLISSPVHSALDKYVTQSTQL